MMVVPLAYLILFSYVPMYGLQIAFKNYRARDGIWGSAWVGLENFTQFFGNYKWPMYVWNTLALSMYSLFASFPVPIILALTIHVNTHKALKKVAQNVSYMPHFISLVVMIGILFSTLHPVAGMLGAIYRVLGVENPIDIRYAKQSFRHLYVWSGVWQGMGWSSILYLATIAGIDPTLYEAAEMDGAGRLRRIWHITLAGMKPIIALKLIMTISTLLSGGFDQIFNMRNPVVSSSVLILDAYIYDITFNALPDYGFSTAVGLFKSVIGFILLMVANKLSGIISGEQMYSFEKRVNKKKVLKMEKGGKH
jgi:ABC-type polysaccharide transport system permease subunit